MAYTERKKLDIEFALDPVNTNITDADDPYLPESIELEGRDSLVLSATVLATVKREPNEGDADTVTLVSVDDTIDLKIIGP